MQVAVRIASAESIRRAILADALFASIVDQIEINAIGKPPIALGASGAIVDLPVIDGLEATWFLKIIGLTLDEISQLSEAVRALFPGAEINPGISGIDVKLYSLVTEELKREVVSAEKQREEAKRIASIENAINYATTLKDGKDGLRGDRGEQGIQGLQGERGPRGVPGRDGKDLVATEATLNDLKDVFVPDPVQGHVLMWDGSSWVSRYLPQVYKYAGGGGGGVSSLDAGDFDG